MDKTGNTGTTFQLINGIFLLASFFGVRLVYGGSVSIQFFFTLYEVWREIPVFYVIIFGSGNLILQGLNILWYVTHVPTTSYKYSGLIYITRFTKMVAALQKRFKPQKNAEHAGLLGNSNGTPAAGTQ